MHQKLFTGTSTALVTPFRNGAIDYEMLDILLERQISAGIKCIVVAGTTGEGSTLSDNEKLDMIAHCKQYVGEQCMVIGGTGSNCTQHAVDLSQAAQERGADALLVVSPYYNKANPSGLRAHYSAIAETVDIPVIVYNVPSRTGVDIPISVYKELSYIPNIAGAKEASNDIGKIQRIRRECHMNFGIWSGNDDMVCASMAIGADGVISVTSNIVPATMKALTDAAARFDFSKAAEIQRNLLPLTDCLFCEVNPIPIKAAMGMLGLDCGPCRLPLTVPSNSHAKVIESSLKQLGIL